MFDFTKPADQVFMDLVNATYSTMLAAEDYVLVSVQRLTDIPNSKLNSKAVVRKNGTHAGAAVTFHYRRLDLGDFLGGESPYVVCDDINSDKAVAQAVLEQLKIYMDVGRFTIDRDQLQGVDEEGVLHAFLIPNAYHPVWKERAAIRLVPSSHLAAIIKERVLDDLDLTANVSALLSGSVPEFTYP